MWSPRYAMRERVFHPLNFGCMFAFGSVGVNTLLGFCMTFVHDGGERGNSHALRVVDSI